MGMGILMGIDERQKKALNLGNRGMTPERPRPSPL